MPVRTREPFKKGATYIMIRQRLSTNLKALRSARDWTQDDAARQCGMPTRSYHVAEGPRGNVTLATLERLSDGFGVDVCELLKPLRKKS